MRIIQHARYETQARKPGVGLCFPPHLRGKCVAVSKQMAQSLDDNSLYPYTHGTMNCLASFKTVNWQAVCAKPAAVPTCVCYYRCVGSRLSSRDSSVTLDRNSHDDSKVVAFNSKLIVKCELLNIGVPLPRLLRPVLPHSPLIHQT